MSKHKRLFWAGCLLSLVWSAWVPAARGQVFVSYPFPNHQIRQYTENGVATVFASGLNLPNGLAFDSAGLLYAVNNGDGSLVKFPAVPVPGGAQAPVSFAPASGSGLIALAAKGTDLYAGNFNASTIRRFPVGGGASSVFANTGMNGPNGLAFDSAGNLYVANRLDNSITMLDGNGAPSIFASGVNSIRGLAWRAGVLYVATGGNNAILNFTATGNLTGTLFPSTYNGVTDPRDLAFDGAGNLYVAAAAAIVKFASNGAILWSVPTGAETPAFIAVQSACEPAVVTCPVNKTVGCGAGWAFDPPVASNATITVASTVTNSLCPLVVTRAWQIVGCGATNTCAQTVTVTPALSFAPPNSPAVISGPIYNPANGHVYYLLTENTWTASETEAVALGGHLATVRSLAENDWIYAQFSQFGGVNRGLWIGLNDAHGLQDGDFVWASGETPGSYFNWGSGEPRNQDGLDDYVHLFWPGDPRASRWNDQWDIIGTQFGSIPINGVVEVSNFPPQLTCATNKTVECGVAWTFDAPLAGGLCGDTNVTVSVSGTVTNGLCPLVVTRTWLATDACGNTNMCSQTVTVRDTTPPALACATNKAVPCGTAWNFDVPLATDGCGANAAGPAPVTVTVLNTVTNSLCPLTVTRTWQAADACGNTNSCSQTVTVNPPPACAGCETWTAHETNRVWYGVASSADGSKLVAVEYAGDIYTSSDSGSTWVPRPVAGGFHGWIAAASDATGQYLVAVANPGQIFTSSDSGVTWVARTTGNKTWVSVASDATGKYLVAAGDNDDLHTSNDYGVTWTARVAGTGVRHWHDVASDTSGKNLIAVGYLGLMFTSHDYGVTWTAQNGGGLDWQSVASDATGTKLVAGVYQGLIYTSGDGGVTWTARASAGSHSWDGLASSADGNKLVAVSFSNRIYCSTDSGVTWTPHESGRQWSSVAASADASKLVAVVYGGGQIYTSSCPPALTLTGAPDKTVEAGTGWSFDPPVVVDSCGGNNATITVSSTATNGVCPLVITRTWQATDACTNSATWHQTVTVTDSAPPILVCATNKTVICGATWSFDAPAASDAFSGTNVTVTILGTVTNGVCPQVITRTWLATDLCGNTNMCAQTVTIQNTVAPVIQCPANIAVTSCTNTVVRYTATATSGCCENVTVALTPPSGTVFFPGTTNTVQAVATDCCGNTAICEFSVTVACAPNPCREFVVNGSFELASPALSPNSFNNGLDPVTGVPGWTTATTNFLEIWRDNAGFPASEGVQQLEINAQSADQTVSQVVTGLSTNCPVQFCFDYTGRFAGNAAGPPRNNFTVTLTSGTAVFSVALNPNAHAAGGWLQFCTNFVPAAATVTIEFHGRPNFPPGSTPIAGGAHIDNVSLTQCCTNNACIQFTAPRDKKVECGKEWGFDAPTNIVDACCDSFNVSFTTVTNGHCPQVITRTWVIADKCGNSSSVSQTVTVSGNTPPILTCATNKIVQCDAKWEFDQPTAVDACSSKEVQLAVLRTVTNGTPCRTEITRTWQATDACGNIATCSQTVTVADTTPPVLLCPRDKTVKCGKAWKFDQPEAADNCCGKAVEIQVLDTSTNGVCPQVITRTWAAVDCCGNRSRCSQTVTVVDVTPPVFTSSLPVLVDEAVILARPLGDLGVVSPGVTLGQTFTAKTEGTLAQVDVWIGNKRPEAKEGADLVLEVREVDAKGLPMEEDALASVVIPARSIPAMPGWVTVPLPNELPVMPGQTLAIVLSVADVNGDGAYEWLGAEEDVYKGGALFSLSTRGWALAGLGRFDGSFTIYVRPPICGTNRKVICGRPWSFPTPRVTDNCCATNVTLAILSTVTNGVCPQVVTRTWVATDCCGNTNTCTQTVSAYPRIPIVITDIKVTAGGPRFAFATEEGETYAVEYKNSLADRSWTMLQTLKGDGTEKQVIDDSKQASIRFYQVRLIEP